jgi:hypothetical protein
VTNIGTRRLRNQILAMSIATVLALYAIGVAMPALTPITAYAINYDNNDKHHEKDKQYDNNDNQYDNGDNYYSQFLIDVEECFIDNGSQDEQFSYEVEQCIYDVMSAYFDDDNNNNNNNNNNEGSSSSGGGTTTTNDNDNPIDDNNGLADENGSMLSQN